MQSFEREFGNCMLGLVVALGGMKVLLGRLSLSLSRIYCYQEGFIILLTTASLNVMYCNFVHSLRLHIRQTLLSNGNYPIVVGQSLVFIVGMLQTKAKRFGLDMYLTLRELGYKI